MNRNHTFSEWSSIFMVAHFLESKLSQSVAYYLLRRWELILDKRLNAAFAELFAAKRRVPASAFSTGGMCCGCSCDTDANGRCGNEACGAYSELFSTSARDLAALL